MYYLKRISRKSLFIFSILLSIFSVTVSVVGLPDSFSGATWYWRTGIALIIISALYAISLIGSMIFTSRKSLTLHMSHKFEVEICFGDILDKTGIIAFSANTYFDTIVDGSIISKETTHGQFIVKYINNNDANLYQLEAEIEDQLAGKPYTLNEDRERGRKRYYPIGTIIEIKKGENVYVMVAMSHFGKENRSICGINDFFNVVSEVITYLDARHKGTKVYIPIFGSGLSRLNRDKMDLLNYILMKINLSDCYFSGGLSIVIPEKYKRDIDLNKIDLQWQ